jgi:hypothetical protein
MKGRNKQRRRQERNKQERRYEEKKEIKKRKKENVRNLTVNFLQFIQWRITFDL